eukprot:CAMPEP_0198284738 /NCGR_PEP_ID=MMETSP1449-20131203/4190_1 /TAXON_ID=420275 /ORGANISM="Attheya septentrionalis, Strain CCMP2084" /LENGTH=1452 /DNA_ID=CAMNT_0043981951 /DNA_START=140 /DNA_END=4498 /DNA_ORIENTATION=-
MSPTGTSMSPTGASSIPLDNGEKDNIPFTDEIMKKRKRERRLARKEKRAAKELRKNAKFAQELRAAIPNPVKPNVPDQRTKIQQIAIQNPRIGAVNDGILPKVTPMKESVSNSALLITPPSRNPKESSAPAIPRNEQHKEGMVSSSFVQEKSVTQPIGPWPSSSAKSLPSLSPRLIQEIDQGLMEYPINEECTSLQLAPSGRHLVAGFTDGTLRLFDLTGKLWTSTHRKNRKYSGVECDFYDEDSSGSEEEESENTNKNKQDQEIRNLFDSDSSEDENEAIVKQPLAKADGTISSIGDSKLTKKNLMVFSKCHQNYGAVACQIQAKGVHTSLLMDVACTEDGMFAFGGVSRGSVELVAVDLSQIELRHDNSCAKSQPDVDILDLIQVYRHSDAKLKGFGACTRLRNNSSDPDELKYLLLTGKGIKNIHIWSFSPPTTTRKEPLWQCLYDTQTNGNTITYLHFRYDPVGLLQGISKSDDQKLRVWDLSWEQGSQFSAEKSMIQDIVKQSNNQAVTSSNPCANTRPKRPPYADVTSTEMTLGVCGPYAFTSGTGGMYNQMSVVCLDVEDVTSPYNHMELALPSADGSPPPDTGFGRRTSRSGRKQRGELKSVINVAGLSTDGGHVLLELSDGSVVHYSQQSVKQGTSISIPQLKVLDSAMYVASTEQSLDDDSNRSGRKMCLARVGAEGMPIVATSSYNSNTGRGTLVLRHLRDPTEKLSDLGFWGFHGVSGHSFLNTHPASEVVTIINKGRSAEKVQKIIASNRISQKSSNLPPTPESKNCGQLKKREKKEKNLSSKLKDAEEKETIAGVKTTPRSESEPVNRLESSPITVPQKPDVSSSDVGNTSYFLTPSPSPTAVKKSVGNGCDSGSNVSTPPPRFAVTLHENKKKEDCTVSGLVSPEQKSDSKVDRLSHVNSFLGENSDEQCGDIKKYFSSSMPSAPIPSKKNSNLSINPSDQKHVNKTPSAVDKANNPQKVKKIKKKKRESPDNSTTKISKENKSLTTKSDILNTDLVKTSVQSSSSKKSGSSIKIARSKSPKSEKGSVKENSDMATKRSVATPCEADKAEHFAHKEQAMKGKLNVSDESIRNSPIKSARSKSPKLAKGCSKENVTQTDKAGHFAHKEQAMKRKVNVSDESIRNSPIKSARSKSPKSAKGCSKENFTQTSPKQAFSTTCTADKAENISQPEMVMKRKVDLSDEAIREIAMTLCNIQRQKVESKTASITEISMQSPSLLSISPVRTSARVRKLDTVEERQIGDIDSFLSSHGFRKRPRLTEGLASETVAQRMDLTKATSSQMSIPIPQAGKTLEKEETKDTLAETRKVIRRSQETARRRLAAHFHASHEMLRKSVLAHVDAVIQKWTVSKKSLYTLDVAKSELNKELAKYQDLARCMMQRQRMEASALAAKQTAESFGIKAPTLTVCFPFPEVFAQSRDSFDSFALTMRGGRFSQRTEG